MKVLTIEPRTKKTNRRLRAKGCSFDLLRKGLDECNDIKNEDITSLNLVERKLSCGAPLSPLSLQILSSHSNNTQDEILKENLPNRLIVRQISNLSKERGENVKDSIARINKVNSTTDTRSNIKILLIKGKKLARLCGSPKGIAMQKVLEDSKKGYLEKKTKKMLTPWKKLFCRVGYSQFLVYKHRQTNLLSGIIDFRRVDASIKCNGKVLSFTIEVRTGNKLKKLFKFRCVSKEELRAWINAIKYNIEKNKEHYKISPAVNYFWKVCIRLILVSVNIRKGLYGESRNRRSPIIYWE